jgi:hypothetical protein
VKLINHHIASSTPHHRVPVVKYKMGKSGKSLQFLAST